MLALANSGSKAKKNAAKDLVSSAGKRKVQDYLNNTVLGGRPYSSAGSAAQSEFRRVADAFKAATLSFTAPCRHADPVANLAC